MTPPDLDREVVHAKLHRLRELLDDLDALPHLDGAVLERDRMLRHAVERVLTQVVELAAGINNHLVAARLGKGALGYRESFLLAADAGALPRDLAERLAPSAGLRNVLVHQYAEIDLDQVAAAVALARTDYRAYAQAIADGLPT